MSTRSCASQLKIRNVNARDEQHKANRGQQHQQKWLDIAHNVFLQWRQAYARTFIRIRIRQRKIVRNLIHVGTSSSERHTGFQAANSACAFVDVAILKERIRELPDRNKYVLGAIVIRALKIEIRGQHTDYGVIFAIHPDSLPDNLRGGAKLALPQTRAEDRHRRRAETIFFMRE